MEFEIDSPFFSHENWLLFDIETTGFDRKKTKVVLVGLIFRRDGDLIVKQVFAESYKDEILLLTELINDFDGKDIYISYNGNNFDIPYLNSRFYENQLYYSIKKYKSFDLYLYFKQNKHIYNLPNVKLKTVEKYLGVAREDTIDGGESVRLYYEYLKTRSNEQVDQICLHNHDDIVNLLRLTDKVIKMDASVISFAPKMMQIQNDLFYIEYSDIYQNILQVAFEKGQIVDDLNVNDGSFILNTLSHDKYMHIPVLKFSSGYDEYVFLDTNLMFDIDFDLLTSSEKSNYLISKNSFVYYSRIGELISKKIALLK